MKAGRSVVFFVRIALFALVFGLLARYLANTTSPLMTRAQSPLPTSTFTPVGPRPTPTRTPTPSAPTNTPTPLPPTNTPVPPTNTPTPVPLVCSSALPSVATLWPPDHKFVAISVLGVRHPPGHPTAGHPIAITVDSIFQDEPLHSPGSGSTSPDGRGVGTATAQVRAERDGGGNGRVYHIDFTATDGHGGTCSGAVLVGVPQSESD
ncbi:MAG: hypothetical protein PVG71_09140, partial [Anaerolineae bacterium]